MFNGTVNVSRRYTVNGLNQYQAAVSGAQSTGFVCDDNGNLISDGTMCLFYDAENRLVLKRAWAADCASAPTSGQVNLRYDPLGRLFEVGGPSGTTRFLYDGDELVMEFAVNADGTATLTKRYVHGPAADDPLVRYEGAGYGDPRFLHTDHQGSVVSVASGTSAAPLVINSYDEWGIPSASNAGRFQYTGQAWLPELGMYHYKARIYSPTLGRFLQTDPIGYDDQINLYAYVGNDPVNNLDPTGLYHCTFPDPETGKPIEGECADATRLPAAPLDGQITSGGEKGRPQIDQKKVDCNSEARQLVELANDAALVLGGSALVFSALGAEPAAAALAGAPAVADGISLLAGSYIYLTEGDAGPLKSSFSGAALGAVGGLGVKAFGGKMGGASWLPYGKYFPPSATKVEAGKYAAGQADGAIPAQVCN